MKNIDILRTGRALSTYMKQAEKAVSTGCKCGGVDIDLWVASTPLNDWKLIP